MAYQKQTWRDYDDTKTELQNVNNGAVVTPERLNHIENGIANSADKAEVTAQLQQTEQELNAQLAQTDVQLNSRIDNIIATPTIVSEQEIIDARQGEPSLGSNFTRYKSELTRIMEHANISSSNLFDGTYVQGNIDSNNGNLVNTTVTGAKATNYIEISGNDKIYTNAIKTYTPYNFVFYDENQKYISTIAAKETGVMPPVGAKYLRCNLTAVNFYTMNLATFYIKQYVNETMSIIDDNVANIDYLKNELEIVESVNLFDKSLVIKAVTDSTTGNLYYGESYATTNKIKILPEYPIYTNVLSIATIPGGTQRGIFFDINNKIINAVDTSENYFTAPPNAEYFVQNLTLTDIGVIINQDKYQVYQNSYSKKFKDISDSISDLISDLDSDISDLDSDITDFIKEFDFNKLDTSSRYVVKAYDFNDVALSDSQIIENCIRFAVNLPYRIIILDTKTWYLDRSIELPSNTILVVDNVTLKQNDSVFDTVIRGNNITVNSADEAGIPEDVAPIKNIKIIGNGNAIIEGPDVFATGKLPGQTEVINKTGDKWGWRTLQISLSKCSNFEISGVTINRPQCWAISVDQCNNGSIHDITVHSTNIGIKNGDGVDIRFGSNNIDVYNISGDTQDDTVAITNLFYDAPYYMEPSVADKSIKTISELPISNISVMNITASNAIHAVICCSNGGLQIHDIYISDIKPISTLSARYGLITLYTGYSNVHPYVDGDIHKIRINDAVSTISKAVVEIDNIKVNDVWVNKAIQKYATGEVTEITYSDGVTITNSKKE